MEREITHTTIKLAKIENKGGLPEAVQMDDEVVVGNVGLEKAQKLMKKKHGANVQVFELIPNTTKYEMPVEDFIKYATVKVDEPVKADVVNEQPQK